MSNDPAHPRGRALEDALDKLDQGLELLHRVDAVNDRYGPAISALAHGTEVLLKVTLGMAREQAGEPFNARDYRHDIGRVLDDLHAACWREPPAVLANDLVEGQWRDDAAWIRDGPIFRRLTTILTAYGGVGPGSRYHWLDLAFRDDYPQAYQAAQDPKTQWAHLQNLVADRVLAPAGRHPGGDLDLYYADVWDAVACTVLRLRRACGRLWLWGVLGPHGTRLSGYVQADALTADTALFNGAVPSALHAAGG